MPTPVSDSNTNVISSCFVTNISIKESHVYLIVHFYRMYAILTKCMTLILPASVAQLGAPSDWRPGGRGFNPCRGRQHSFVEIDHEIFSTVILSLPLIQEGQLSVSGERMCIILVNRLEDSACPVNVWLGKLTALDMTPLG